jgi:hypothetical protein
MPLPIGLDFFHEHIAAGARHFIRGDVNLAGLDLVSPTTICSSS